MHCQVFQIIVIVETALQMPCMMLEHCMYNILAWYGDQSWLMFTRSALTSLILVGLYLVSASMFFESVRSRLFGKLPDLISPPRHLLEP